MGRGSDGKLHLQAWDISPSIFNFVYESGDSFETLFTHHFLVNVAHLSSTCILKYCFDVQIVIKVN